MAVGLSLELLYNANQMVKAIMSLLVGAVLGTVLNVLVGMYMDRVGRDFVYNGVFLGFGAGFGAVAAIWVLNKLVGYFDRLMSGKA